jgi:GT2 family glycosyltransferase
MAVSSVLGSDHDSFELVVVDQSTDDSSARYLAGIADARLRVVRTDTVGLSNGRNVGVAAARSDVVLMTDDDCVVDAGWIAGMERLFSDGRVAMVFGPVDAAPCDTSVGFVPAGPITQRRTFDRVRTYDPRAGIGASCGVRRSAVMELGGFDPLLGAGARFKSGEEVDMALRLLLAGYHVVHDTSTAVVHHGFRTFDQARSLVRGYMYGTAACHIKLVRSGHPAVLGSFARALWGSLAPPILSAVRARQVPRVLGRITWSARGIGDGVRTPRDPERPIFRE